MLSRKRSSKSGRPFVPPFAQPPAEKLLKLTTGVGGQDEPVSSVGSAEPGAVQAAGSPSSVSKMVFVLADAGCTLMNVSGPPCVPSNLYKFRQRLEGVLSEDRSIRSQFLKGFSDYISSEGNMRRVLLPCQRDGFSSVRSTDSLVRLLLLVKCIQEELIETLLEKLPEYFNMEPVVGGHGFSSTPRFDEDVARLILNQFRWLDFLVNSEGFVEKLLQVISICPHNLKKEMIGSLPEIIGDQNNKTVFSSLQEMLQEDSSVVVPVLDAFSNLNLDDLLQDQVIMIALSCIRTIDVDHMPYLLRFLLISAKASNARLLISKIREQLKFVGASHARASQLSKLKGKSVVDNTEASILDTLRSSLRFKNMLCLELLQELKTLKEAQDHKVIDIWLLTLVFMSCEPLQKSVQKEFKKKIIEGCFHGHMFDQCIRGIKDSSKDYLPTFLSLSASMLSCKEERAQEFGIHMYTCLFEEFCDAYSRQEVLGALLTHVGSGIWYEVSAALDALVNLATKRAQELITLSSHIIGLLDYLEGFGVESLHKVYEVFIRVAVSAQSSSQSYGCSMANELLMILRKQINNSDLTYKMMGLIGTLKIVSYIADTNNASLPPLSQRSNYEEAMELLEISFNSCRQPLPLMLFHEELVSTLQCTTLHPTIMAWVGKQVGEFESIYLSDLDNGNLTGQDLPCELKGELWMNLDGDISPICVNILPLIFPSSGSTSPLQVLPSKFVLLSVVEKLSNQGSLGGIDALLGCPFHLPSSKLFSQSSWKSLNAKQKQILILSLYYAANWMRELLNAFSTQVVEERNAISQATREEVILKLVKRMRNLVFIESLLDNCLKLHPVLLPELYPHLETSSLTELDYMGDMDKMTQCFKGGENVIQKKKSKSKSLMSSTNSNVEDKLKQPTIVDVWKKAGAIPSQDTDGHKEDLCVMSSNATQSEPAENHADNSCEVQNIEISVRTTCVEAQNYKFRPLSVDCLSILTSLEDMQGSCCSDPSAELPLHLYVLRDLHKKLDHIGSTRKQNLGKQSIAPAGCTGMKVSDLLRKIRPLFQYIRRNFDRAVCSLREGAETCEEHWITQSNLASNPEMIDIRFIASPSLTSISVVKESLLCFGKILNLPDVLKDKLILSDLLRALQPKEMPRNFFQGMKMIPSQGDMDYLYSSAYVFLGGVFDVAINFSFSLASEVLLTLELLITSIRTFLSRPLHENGRDTCMGFSKEIVPFLCNKMGSYAQKLLMNNCGRDDSGSSVKTKGEVIQKILRIYLGNRESSDLLNELACSMLSQASSSETHAEDDNQTFPTLCAATMTVWYRVLHEENISTLNNLVTEIGRLEKPRGDSRVENVQKLLNKILQSVNVVVTLINLCRNTDKVAVHAMAVKYGGKYIDSFLKVFDFLQAEFPMHKDLILDLIKELQKATRTVQTLCSEAKGSKQTIITGKIPATKRSLERFLFHVKALLYTTPSGCSFWMGNLKHKDLMGQVVSSQAYLDDDVNYESNNEQAEPGIDGRPSSPEQD